MSRSALVFLLLVGTTCNMVAADESDESTAIPPADSFDSQNVTAPVPTQAPAAPEGETNCETITFPPNGKQFFQQCYSRTDSQPIAVYAVTAAIDGKCRRGNEVNIVSGKLCVRYCEGTFQVCKAV